MAEKHNISNRGSGQSDSAALTPKPSISASGGKHTPGPWEVEKGVDVVCRQYATPIAHCYTQRREFANEAEANASLIAAAPNLLAFVRRRHSETMCICGIQANLKGTHLETDIECTKCVAAALIEEAEGAQ